MNHSKLLTARNADKGRPKAVLFYYFSATIAAMVGYAAYKYTEYATSFGFFYCAAILTSLCFTQIFFRTEILEGQKRWQQNDRSIILTITHILLAWELGTLVLVSLSFVVGVATFFTRSRGEWIAPTMLMIIGAFGLRYLAPIFTARGFTRRRISLNRNDIELTQISGHTDTIPWKANPHLIGVHQGDAVIALKNHDELRYPIGYLPISLRQLERLLSTFSTNSKLCTKLSSPEALDTVLAILEPTEEELTDGSWNWRPTAPAESQT